MKSILATSLLVLALAGCASRDKPAESKPEGSLAENVGAAADSTVSQTQAGFADAALSPLEDLNLRRDQIPPLLAAMKNPYDLPADLSCEQISAMISELGGVLGPDWDTPRPDERLNTEKLADEASDAALGAVESGVTGWIPYRGLLREATGAAAHQRKYNQAYRIGAQRRTYLKGYGLAMGCEPPARPDFEAMAEETDERIVIK
ncbi:hypothetical protein [Hyphomonas sp.]|uniref:hypothetical protein n=1 Tax=Hyphomonas sp. TaxID=87 RepID=UPI00391D3F3D